MALFSAFPLSNIDLILLFHYRFPTWCSGIWNQKSMFRRLFCHIVLLLISKMRLTSPI